LRRRVEGRPLLGARTEVLIDLAGDDLKAWGCEGLSGLADGGGAGQICALPSAIFPVVCSMAAVPLVVFSDFACPFSYVTEAAVRRMQRAGEVQPAWMAWELYPAPAPLPEPSGGWIDALRPLADELDLPLLVRPLAVRTRKAHEAAAFAERKGVGRQMREALFAAYFGEGRDISRIDVLAELGAGLGLDVTEMRVVLDVGGAAARIDAELQAARGVGVTQTPTLVAGTGHDARWIVGARPFAELRSVILEQ
jgi:predicted DsbA family dithiol-disulfide isomerase